MTTNERPGDSRSADLHAEIVASLDGADDTEAAAVAVAIGAHLRDRELQAAMAAETDGVGGWAGRRWAYADRLGRVADRSVRVPDGAPSDPWTAAGRADRL